MRKVPYDPELMRFLYFLTKYLGVMNSIEIAKKFTSESGEKITDRTIRRWFRHLQNYCYDYYNYLKYEKLGLSTIYAIITGDKNLIKLLNGFPLHDYVVYYLDSKNLKNILLVRYLIPRKKIKDLKTYLKSSKNNKLIKDFELHFFKTPTIIYSPLHKVIDEKGNLDFSNINENDYIYFFELLKRSLKENQRISLSECIKVNPLMLPILFTQHREHWSSVKIWNDIKARIGEDIWNYLKKVKKKTDPVGIRYVQKTLSQLYTNHSKELLHQTRVEYNPIVLDNYATTIFFLDFQNNTSLINFVKDLSKRCLLVYVYPPYSNEKNYMVYTITGYREIQEIITEFAEKYKFNKILWRDRKKFKELWGRQLAKFKYEKIFNPIKCEWI